MCLLPTKVHCPNKIIEKNNSIKRTHTLQQNLDNLAYLRLALFPERPFEFSEILHWSH